MLTEARELGVLQLHLSWAETDEQAMQNAMTEWPNGGMKFAKADIRSPHDFAAMAALVRPEDFEGRMVISSDPDVHRAHIQQKLGLSSRPELTRYALENGLIDTYPIRRDRKNGPSRTNFAVSVSRAIECCRWEGWVSPDRPAS